MYVNFHLFSFSKNFHVPPRIPMQQKKKANSMAAAKVADSLAPAQFLHIKIINAGNSCHFIVFTEQLRCNKGAFQFKRRAHSLCH